jgi:hydroxymethylbilane synthase
MGFAAGETQIVWASGARTWERLASRGIWVHGCSEGLGDDEAPNVDVLAGGVVDWRRLTHSGSDAPDAVATYAVTQPLPDTLAARTHFYWTSGSQFRAALERFPQIREGWHASGPGRTARVIRDTLETGTRRHIWLDYEQWLLSVLR